MDEKRKDFRPRLCKADNEVEKTGWQNIVNRCKHLGLGDAQKILFGDLAMSDAELIESNVKLAKSKQKFQDLNRIERKAFRENARIENALGQYHKALVERLEANPISIVPIKHKVKKEGNALILQLSDTHFNELVDLISNKYDFKIASKRLFLLADEIISIGKWKKTKRLVVTFGGDLLNSDRRKDELLSMSTNRSNASLLSAELLAKMLLHLANYFNITTCCVTGNESRSGMELGWTEVMACDSYDTIIYGMLYFMLRKDKRFHFIPIKGNEVVFTVNGKNFLQIHGHQIKGDLQKAVQQIIGKYANRGVIIHYVLFGHIHACNIGDYFSRNSSTVGSNAYSEEGLNYVSFASQNVHIVDGLGRINSMKIDLQNVSDVVGYDINDECDCYCARSIEKNKQETTIFKVVI